MLRINWSLWDPSIVLTRKGFKNYLCTFCVKLENVGPARVLVVVEQGGDYWDDSPRRRDGQYSRGLPPVVLPLSPLQSIKLVCSQLQLGIRWGKTEPVPSHRFWVRHEDAHPGFRLVVSPTPLHPTPPHPTPVHPTTPPSSPQHNTPLIHHSFRPHKIYPPRHPSSLTQSTSSPFPSACPAVVPAEPRPPRPLPRYPRHPVVRRQAGGGGHGGL